MRGGAVRSIFVDLDCTLIDSERRYEDEKRVAENFGVPRAIYEWAVDELYKRYEVGSYSFPLLCEIIRPRMLNFPEELHLRLASLLSCNYFFSDALDFLARFSQEELVLVTSGNQEFQQKKIQTHELAKYFGRIFVARNKAQVIGEEKAGTDFFIDDAPREIEKVKLAHPDVFCVQVRTPASWESQKYTSRADARLSDLISAAEYIKAALA